MALLLNLIHVLKAFPYLLSGSKSTLLSYSLSNWPFPCSQPDMSWSYWASLPHLPNSFYWAFQVSFKQPLYTHQSTLYLAPAYSQVNLIPLSLAYALYSLPCLLQLDVPPLCATPQMPFS